MAMTARRQALVRGFVVWVALIAAELVHGIARALWLVPAVGDFRARQVGVFTGTIINLFVATVCIGWIRPPRAGTAFLVGAMWLVLTVLFELGFGRLALRASWERIGSDYNVLDGGLLPFGLLALAFAPLLAARFRRIL
jgi:hypothetical protein